MDKISAILAQAATLLTGEPARFIGYGAAAVIYIVAKVFNVIPDQSLDDAVKLAFTYVAVVASVVESIRHFVYSPNSVAVLKATVVAPSMPAPETPVPKGAQP